MQRERRSSSSLERLYDEHHGERQNIELQRLGVPQLEDSDDGERLRDVELGEGAFGDQVDVILPELKRKRKRGLGKNRPQKKVVGPMGIVDLRYESESALIEDLELYTELFALWQVTSEDQRAKVKLAKEDLAKTARHIRDDYPELWTENVSAKLNETLNAANKVYDGHNNVILQESTFANALQEIDDDSVRTLFLLQKTFYRREINMRECCKVTMGWICLTLVLYTPWLVVTALRFKDRESCSAAEESFVLAFMIFLSLNCLINYFASCLHSIDRGVICKDAEVTQRWASRTVLLYTAIFIAFNIYGLTLFWSPSNDDSECSMRGLLLAIIVAFLILPCICLSLDMALKDIR